MRFLSANAFQLFFIILCFLPKSQADGDHTHRGTDRNFPKLPIHCCSWCLTVKQVILLPLSISCFIVIFQLSPIFCLFIYFCSVLSCMPFCFNKKSFSITSNWQISCCSFLCWRLSSNLPWWRGKQQLLLPINPGHSNICAVLIWSFQNILNLSYLLEEKVYRVLWTVTLQLFLFAAN